MFLFFYFYFFRQVGFWVMENLCDPFQVAFLECATIPSTSLQINSSVVPTINTEVQWIHFCTTLKKQGLLSDPDIMDDIWVELSVRGDE